jgi:hypothetical protein
MPLPEKEKEVEEQKGTFIGKYARPLGNHRGEWTRTSDLLKNRHLSAHGGHIAPDLLYGRRQAEAAVAPHYQRDFLFELAHMFLLFDPVPNVSLDCRGHQLLQFSVEHGGDLRDLCVPELAEE